MGYHRVVPIPRSPIEGRYLTASEFSIICERAKVKPSELRSWQSRYVRINREVEKRIDAVVDDIIKARCDASMQADGDVSDTLCSERARIRRAKHHEAMLAQERAKRLDPALEMLAEVPERPERDGDG